MRLTAILFAALFCGTIALAPQAEAGKPGGCIKYGVAGAVAGHYAQHHAVRGAVLGCVAGIARRHQYNKQQELLKQQQLKEQQQPKELPKPTPQ
ncbi:MAG: hypothetical protein ACLQIQ_16055 [Beijerinckiaceae bacterium]